MNNNKLNRVTFLDENKFLVDEKHEVCKCGKGDKEFLFGGKYYGEDDLFNRIDEISTTGSVGGGYEGNGLKFDKKFYNPNLMEQIKQKAKQIITEMEANEHPAKKQLDQMRDTNKVIADEAIKKTEDGINIVYTATLKAQFNNNWFNDGNDYNNSGVPDAHKENATLLDLKYDYITPKQQEMNTASLSKDPVGKQMVDIANKKAVAADKNPFNDIMQLGNNDMEYSNNTNQEDKKNIIQKNHGFNMNSNQKFLPLKEGQKLRFKYPELDFENGITESIVPDKVKVDGMLFEMMDGQSNLVSAEWKNGLLLINNQRNLLKEGKEQEKINKFFSYKKTAIKNNNTVESGVFKNTVNSIRTQMNTKL